MAGLVIFLAVAGAVQLRSIISSLDSVVDMLREIAEGRGDLTRRIVIRSRNELADLGDYFNRFSSQLQNIIQEILKVSTIVAGSSKSVSSAAVKLRHIAEAQYRTNEEITASSENMSRAITCIADDARNLLREACDASSSSTEIAASFEEIVNLTIRLDQSTDQTLDAINQIAHSSGEVADNVAEVLNRADYVVKSIVQINQNAEDIMSHARKQSAMSQSVQDNASRFGLTAITQTKERMERIRSVVNNTTDVMDNLGKLSEEINRIVSIISNITGKTNLLALNASIIAAQVGEQGKGFAVVAGEMKALAMQTAYSTKEIEEMIVQIQTETAIAIATVRESSREVDEGVTLSQEVAAAFYNIIDNTAQSLQTALEVSGKAEEQSKDIVKVSDSISKIGQMLSLINTEADRQKSAADEIVLATKEMHSCSHDVRITVSAQSSENQRLSKLFESVYKRVEVIADATEEQRQAVEAIAVSQEKLHDRAEENIHAAAHLELVVTELERQSELLDAKVNTFRVQ